MSADCPTLDLRIGQLKVSVGAPHGRALFLSDAIEACLFAIRTRCGAFLIVRAE
jgi:hypothetical protein